MKLSYTDRFDEIETFIRRGLHSAARKALFDYELQELPRNTLAAYANLCRRAGLIDRGLHTLNSVIRTAGLRESASLKEKLEYAMLLVKVGALGEAQELFAAMESRDNPDVLLYSIFALVPQWRYEETIEPLELFLLRPDVTDYNRMIAKVNLIAALIFCGDDERASDLVKSALKEASAAKNENLLGSLFELQAQLEIQNRDYSGARESLNSALVFLRDGNSSARRYVEKWKHLLAFIESKDPLRARAGVEKFRKQALLSRDWETVRDCDFQILRIIPDRVLFERLVCGTPLKGYRDRVSKLFPEAQPVAEDYLWRINGEATAAHQELSVISGLTGQGKEVVEPGRLPHLLLNLLSRDFYRPMAIAGVAAELFPGEYYHYEYTPQKIHQLIHRLRESLTSSGLSLKVVSENSLVSLYSTRPCALVKKWQHDLVPVTRLDFQSPLLARAFGEREFTAKEAAGTLNVSVSTASRRLKILCESGDCHRVGQGKGTSFKIGHPPQNKTKSKIA